MGGGASSEFSSVLLTDVYDDHHTDSLVTQVMTVICIVAVRIVFGWLSDEDKSGALSRNWILKVLGQ